MDINALMKQAQQMQNDLASAQDELKAQVYSATVGGGVVKVSVDGSFQVTSIDINEDLLEKEGKETLEELVLLAMNDALTQASKDKEEKMSALTSGVNVPGIF